MAASEKKLGALHEAVADALTEQVRGYTVTKEDGAEEVVKASPALLSAAIAFLKNNNITADAEDNEALRELGNALKARRKKQLPQAALDAAALDYTRQMGGETIQ